MAGIRIGGNAILLPQPDIPILAVDNSPLLTKTIWKIGNAAIPEMMTQTAVSASAPGHPNLGDPQREPTTGDSVVYSRFTIDTSSGGTIGREVRLVDWENTTDIQLYTETGSAQFSCEPTWKPDGSKIMFRAKGAGSSLNLIKDMDPDGSSVATLVTASAEVRGICYSPDGTMIAWAEGASIWVANADGSSAGAVLSPGVGTLMGSPAWQRGANVIGCRYTLSTNEIWVQFNADGSGLTTLLTISRAGYGPGQGNPSAIMYSWLSNDTDIVTTVRQVADPDPDARLTLIDSSGSNLVSPARYAGADSGAGDLRPVALTGMAEGVERLYWAEQIGPPITVASVLPDGSDYRVDFDGSGYGQSPGGSTFAGFRGDTVNNP